MQTENQKNTDKKRMGASPSVKSCIENCLECFQICAQTMVYCLEKGGKHADLRHIKLLNDCSKICNMSAVFMLGRSDYHPSICQVCAEICEACAKSCEAFAGDEMMKACAEISRKCATSCGDMAKIQQKKRIYKV